MDKKLQVAYFLGALGAWLKQLQTMGLSSETSSYLKLGINQALDELRGGELNG